MIDSHCHLADTQFANDLPDVLSRAMQTGVERFVTIADTLEEGEKCIEIARKYEQIFCTIGVHPHASSLWKKESGEQLQALLTSSNKVVALGEIGLDYHYMHSPKEDQIYAFREQIKIAQLLDLPIVVHNRESIEDLMIVIREMQPTKMVLHCCTEKWDDVAELIERGYLLGFTGMATYPKLDRIRDTIAHCPLQHMMIETDAPYLAPQSYRGKRCEPAFVVEVAKLIAEIKGISLEEVDEITTKNTEEFYGWSG